MKEFTVDSMGHCFLCLSENQPEFLIPSWGRGQRNSKNLQWRSSSSFSPSPCPASVNSSIQFLSNYLKLDMKKVLSEDGPIPENLLDKVERSKLKVELCPECKYLGGKFARIYRQLEKIQMEVRSCLELINGKMVKAEEDDGAGAIERKLKNSVGSGSKQWLMMGKLMILRKLRKATMDKCSQRLKAEQPPRVKIGRLIHPKITKPNIDIGRVKMERIPVDPLLEEDDDEDVEPDGDDDMEVDVDLDDRNIISGGNQESFTNQSSDDEDGSEEEGPHKKYLKVRSDIFSDDFEQEEKSDRRKQQLRITQTVKTTPNHVRATRNGKTSSASADTFKKFNKDQHWNQWSIDPVTRQYKCDICHHLFPKFDQIKRHFVRDHDHVKIRYRCYICQQEFPSGETVLQHRKDVHKTTVQEASLTIPHLPSNSLGPPTALKKLEEVETPKFKCDLCDKEYSFRESLRRHHRNVHLGVRYPCQYCKREFTERQNLRVHQSSSIRCGRRGVPEYSCKCFCGKGFHRLRDLGGHLDTGAHANDTTNDVPDEKHKCDLCGCSFKLEATLTKHRQSYHSHSTVETEDNMITAEGVVSDIEIGEDPISV